jgi:hypothetical protein
VGLHLVVNGLDGVSIGDACVDEVCGEPFDGIVAPAFLDLFA